MYQLGFTDKQKPVSTDGRYIQYLALPSEPKYVRDASRGLFGFRNRYLAKRKVMRTIRRLRRDSV